MRRVHFSRNVQFHSIFHLSEDTSGELFSDLIVFHVLELPKLHLAPRDRQVKLERWARFLTARTPIELQAIAAEDPIMTTAKHAIEELSADPNARRIARDRETAVLVHRHLMAASLEEGKAEGRAEGKAEGRAEGKTEGLQTAVRSLCSVLAIPIDGARERLLTSIDVEKLTALVRAIESTRRWPDEF